MHEYIKAIGYDSLTSENQVNELLRDAENAYAFHKLSVLDSQTDYCEYRTETAPNMGICVCGTMDVFEHFERHFYFPYFKGSGVTMMTDVTLEKRIDREAYVGMCEDPQIGFSLVFTVANAQECILNRNPQSRFLKETAVTLSGLCNEGVVLLPVMKDADSEKRSMEAYKSRSRLQSEARNGNPAAFEQLALNDYDTYAEVSRRLVTDDIFTIVDTYFMPNGFECDCYSILGEILRIRKVTNWQTDEEVYIMHLEVNGLRFDVCVPVDKVVGMPAAGRRFKGDIWLQGYITN